MHAFVSLVQRPRRSKQHKGFRPEKNKVKTTVATTAVLSGIGTHLFGDEGVLSNRKVFGLSVRCAFIRIVGAHLSFRMCWGSLCGSVHTFHANRLMKAGSVVIRDLRLWHSGTPNLGKSTRLLPVRSAEYAMYIDDPQHSRSTSKPCRVWLRLR